MSTLTAIQADQKQQIFKLLRDTYQGVEVGCIEIIGPDFDRMVSDMAINFVINKDFRLSVDLKELAQSGLTQADIQDTVEAAKRLVEMPEAVRAA